MKLLYWDRSLIHIIGSYLEYGENGILNLLSYKYYNKNNKLHINGFILNKKMREWFCEKFKFDISIVNYNWAAANGHLNCLKYAHKNQHRYICSDRVCSLAAKYGNLNCLKYLHENGYPWDKWTCHGAAHNGHLNCLKYAHENGCPWDEETCRLAALNGHLNILKYLHENGCPYNIKNLLLLEYNNIICIEYIKRKMK